MEKEVNFLAQYEVDQALLNEPLDIPAFDVEKGLERLHKTMDKVELYQSQFQKVKNEELWVFWINGVFEVICDMAKMQYGRAVLSVNEESLVGKITYWGREVMCSDAWGDNIHWYAAMISKASEIVLAVENGLIKFDIIFGLSDKIQIADKTEEIKSLFPQER